MVKTKKKKNGSAAFPSYHFFLAAAIFCVSVKMNQIFFGNSQREAAASAGRCSTLADERLWDLYIFCSSFGKKGLFQSNPAAVDMT